MSDRLERIKATHREFCAAIAAFERGERLHKGIAPLAVGDIDWLISEVERLTIEKMNVCADRDATHAELERLRKRCEEARELVSAQANDEGLWFEAQTTAEGYLQQELRRRHKIIEGEK